MIIFEESNFINILFRCAAWSASLIGEDIFLGEVSACNLVFVFVRFFIIFLVKESN